MRAWLLILGAPLLASVPSPSLANGRFPHANQVLEDTADARRIVLRTTFGLVETRDAGATWRWTCERAAGYGGSSLDPSFVISAGGGLIAGVGDGVFRTTDGCAWGRVTGPLDGRYVVDLARDANGRVLAVASYPGERATFAASTDEGATWSSSLLPEDLDPLTVDAAPSRPSRVYVTGRAPFPRFGTLARSDDFGATWALSVFDLRGASGVFLSAVDPHDPDLLYARFDRDTSAALFVSRNGGTTWTAVLEGKGPLLGFALSPWGDAIAVGGPEDGLLVSPTSALAFVPRTSHRVRCLGWTPSGLYACAEEPSDGFSLGLLAPGAATVRPLYHLPDVRPLVCPAGTTVATMCPADWPAVGRSIGAIRDPDAGVVADASADARDGSEAPGPPDPITLGARGGYDCATVPGTSHDRATFAAIGAALLALFCVLRATGVRTLTARASCARSAALVKRCAPTCTSSWSNARGGRTARATRARSCATAPAATRPRERR